MASLRSSAASARGVWLVVFALTRYASVASIVSALSLPLWAWLLGYPWPVTAFAGVAAVGVLVLHRANLRRLVRGEEPRFAAGGASPRSQSLSSLCRSGPCAPPRELGAQLADRAVALGDDLVRVDRLEVQLPREAKSPSSRSGGRRARS